MTSRVSVVLLAGGQGSRMGMPTPKQYLHLSEKPIARYSFELFLALPSVAEIVVVCEPEYRSLFTELGSSVPVRFAAPGAQRQDSCYSGLQIASADCDLVCFHDSARPLIRKDYVEALFEEGLRHGAACIAMPIKCTVKQSCRDGFVLRTLERSSIWEIQTPQVGRRELFQKGYAEVHANKLSVTDDVSVIELLGHPVKLVKGCYSNLKITTPEDLAVAEQLLSQQIS